MKNSTKKILKVHKKLCIVKSMLKNVIPPSYHLGSTIPLIVKASTKGQQVVFVSTLSISIRTESFSPNCPKNKACLSHKSLLEFSCKYSTVDALRYLTSRKVTFRAVRLLAQSILCAARVKLRMYCHTSLSVAVNV